MNEDPAKYKMGDGSQEMKSLQQKAIELCGGGIDYTVEDVQPEDYKIQIEEHRVWSGLWSGPHDLHAEFRRMARQLSHRLQELRNTYSERLIALSETWVLVNYV